MNNETISLNGKTWTIGGMKTFSAFNENFLRIECFRLELVEVVKSPMFRPRTMSVIYSSDPKPAYLANILKKRFEPVDVISKDWSTRSDCRHESDFFQTEIDALTAAGFATVKNAGLNVYYINLTEKGRKASGLEFGWIASSAKLQEALSA